MNWGNLFGSIKNLFGGASNAIGGALKTGGNAIGGVANAGANVGKNLVGQLGKSGINPMSMFGGSNAFAGQQPQTSPMNIPFMGQAAPAGRNSVMTSSLSPASTIGSLSAGTDKKNAFGGILEQMFPGGTAQGMAGLAMPLLGDMFAPKSPNIPDMGSLSSVQALQNFKPGQSVSPEYQAMLQRNTQQLRDTKVRELQQLYHNARPGTDYLTDSAYQRDLAKIDQDIQMNMGDSLAQAEATFSGQEQERLSQIAQMDIYSIMAQTGLDAQEASDFKSMFSNMGNTLLTSATRKPGGIEAR